MRPEHFEQPVLSAEWPRSTSANPLSCPTTPRPACDGARVVIDVVLRRAPQEIFPDAEVEAAVNNTSSVAISSGGTKIVSVAQRDLYRKYQWPAAPKIKEMLEMYKDGVAG